MTRLIPLDQLRFGHEAEPPINARRVGRQDGVPELAASIGAHGLITPLRVKQVDGIAYVGIGNRRLAAMRLLVEQSQMTVDFPVECIDFDLMDGDPREIALAEQILRVPLHEADQYEEFRALADTGLSEAVIASRFGIEPKRVKRILALGRLSPSILDWWRQQAPDRNTTDTVRAFTLAPSLAEQERIFKKLSKSGSLWANTVSSEFGAGDRAAAKNVTFVGIDAYTMAGGHVTEDLFGDNHIVSDPALAAKLAAEKLQSKAADIAKEGWSWVSVASDLPDGWSWNWQKLHLSKKKATKAQKAQSGAVVAIDREGKLEVTYGVVKPEAQKKEKAAPGEKKEKAAPAISNAMAHRLSVAMTTAVQASLPADPRVALAALVAGLTTRDGGSPVKLRKEGFGDYEAIRDAEPYEAVLTRLLAMTSAEIMLAAAHAMSKTIDYQRHHAEARLSPGHDALVQALASDPLQTALHESFDAADYFAGVAKPLVIAAIREAINEDEARKADKLKKKELVEFAVKNVQPTGWLPPELRCATYSGPGEIPPAGPERSPPRRDRLPDTDVDEGDEVDVEEFDTGEGAEEDEMEPAE